MEEKLTMEWNEKTLKIAKMVITILGSVAAAITVLTTTLAGLDVDVSVMLIITTVIDGLAAAVAAFFGIEKEKYIAAQKEEIAALKNTVAQLKNPNAGEDTNV